MAMNSRGTLILATVGTSLLNHMKRELSTDERPPIQQALATLRKMDHADTRMGAEINSCESLLKGFRVSSGVTGPPFCMVFMVSDTDDGDWTGQVLTKYYTTVRKIDEVAQTRIVGLTPNDPNKFAHVGLRNLVREAARRLRDADNKGLFRVINATGGFKAQISFAGLIGQTLNVPVIYQFETFPLCVELPPMPVDFDRQSWLTNYDLFCQLSEKGAMEETEFQFRDVDEKIHNLLDQETVDGKTLYSLSPILELMHQGFLFRKPHEMSEPPLSEIPLDKKLALVKKELSHAPKGTENIALALVHRFPWIKKIKNRTPKMNSARSHLLPRKPGDLDHDICFSDGELGVKLSIKTTSEHEGHAEYVSEQLAAFLNSY